MEKRFFSDISRSFQHVVEKALVLGIDGAQLAALPSVRQLKSKNIDEKRCYFKFPLVPALFIGLFALFLPNMNTYHRLAKLFIHNSDLHDVQCTLDMPPALQHVFRPPVDCAVCRHVFTVDRINSVSREEFKEKYAYTGRPVVVTDGTTNWTALKKFNFPFFKNLYAEDSPALENSREDCQFFPYDTDFETLGDVFNMSEERALLKDKERPWYIGWSNCDTAAANILRQHYSKPYFLPVDAEPSNADWIFMGSPGYGARLHIDHVVNPSWQAQITGRKQWTLEPPPECASECRPMDVTVDVGEMIILDTNLWYHQTLILGDELSITIGSEYD